MKQVTFAVSKKRKTRRGVVEDEILEEQKKKGRGIGEKRKSVSSTIFTQNQPSANSHTDDTNRKEYLRG